MSIQMALHLKGSCKVSSVKVQTFRDPKSSSLETWKNEFQHVDPLQHVLIKPAASYTEFDAKLPHVFDADAHFNARGAAGMTTGLRASSIASNMGELRLSVQKASKASPSSKLGDKDKSPEQAKARAELAEKWKQDIIRSETIQGFVVKDLYKKLEERARVRRNARIQLIAKGLAEAYSFESGNRAFKITVSYQIPIHEVPSIHLGGLHVHTNSNYAPHVYTTSGVVGDHAGPRSWLPCLDSASFQHRSSHEITIKVTAPMKEGLSMVGMGEDMGASETLLHDDGTTQKSLRMQHLGLEHVQCIQTAMARNQSTANLIPPGPDDGEIRTVLLIDAILATNVWTSCSWLPIAARSLGFAIGPFKLVEDPEYFCLGHDAVDCDEKQIENAEKARSRGEGIRQAYFAPMYERKLIHEGANKTLLPDVDIRLFPLSSRQVRMAKELDETVIRATAGVPHRALSLMRDLLAIGGVVGAVPVGTSHCILFNSCSSSLRTLFDLTLCCHANFLEDRNNDQLWRSTTNGPESHTSAMDEFNVRQILCRDVVDTLERGTDIDKSVPLPSMGWLGSHLSLAFLSSNASSSSDLGCGALELQHATGGLVYRALKCDVLRRVVEGRAGVANFIRLLRAAFIASNLDDLGEKELKLPSRSKKDMHGNEKRSERSEKSEIIQEPPKPPFLVCVNELLKKKGLTHTLFTRALQNLCGRIREAQLLGTQVDVEKDMEDPRTKQPFVDPEGFPNSFVRGASSLLLRVGVHVEAVRDAGGGQQQNKGIQLQAYAEPVIPVGGIAYSGPVTFRVVENEGAFREYVKEMTHDGSRRDWGTTFLHAKPVTLPKDQTAAGGTIETNFYSLDCIVLAKQQDEST